MNYIHVQLASAQVSLVEQHWQHCHIALGPWAANVAKHQCDMIDIVQEFWCRYLPCRQLPVTHTVVVVRHMYSGASAVAKLYLCRHLFDLKSRQRIGTVLPFLHHQAGLGAESRCTIIQAHDTLTIDRKQPNCGNTPELTPWFRAQQTHVVRHVQITTEVKLYSSPTLIRFAGVFDHHSYPDVMLCSKCIRANRSSQLSKACCVLSQHVDISLGLGARHICRECKWCMA